MKWPVCCVQVKMLGEEAERLTDIHPDQADEIRKKQAEIEANWEKLKRKVTDSCQTSMLIEPRASNDAF